jgi:hypothetical protein
MLCNLEHLTIDPAHDKVSSNLHHDTVRRYNSHLNPYKKIQKSIYPEPTSNIKTNLVGSDTKQNILEQAEFFELPDPISQ